MEEVFFETEQCIILTHLIDVVPGHAREWLGDPQCKRDYTCYKDITTIDNDTRSTTSYSLDCEIKYYSSISSKWVPNEFFTNDNFRWTQSTVIDGPVTIVDCFISFVSSVNDSQCLIRTITHKIYIHVTMAILLNSVFYIPTYTFIF